eukprot:5981315-Prymnesium_polylepis.4
MTDMGLTAYELSSTGRHEALLQWQLRAGVLTTESREAASKLSEHASSDGRHDSASHDSGGERTAPVHYLSHADMMNVARSQLPDAAERNRIWAYVLIFTPASSTSDTLSQ